MKLELTEQDVSIITQALSNISVPVREAPVIMELINKIQRQTTTQPQEVS